MSNYIARKYVGGYTFVFHTEGTVHVEIQGKHRAYDICDALCDPYDGESLIGYDTTVPFDDYIKYAWLRVFPHMEYAYKKCGDSILTFVEKDGVPYGTIDYDLNYHHILQARIDQTDYSKSNMPADVVKLFMKHVSCMLENK